MLQLTQPGKSKIQQHGMMTIRYILIFMLLAVSPPARSQNEKIFEWQEVTNLPPFGNQSTANGIAGAFTGIIENKLIVAGGISFIESESGTTEVFHSDILILKENTNEWIKAGSLISPVAFGSSVTIEGGVLCFGGCYGGRILDDIIYLKWDDSKQKIVPLKCGNLPKSTAYGSAVELNGYIYIADGQSECDPTSAQNSFWRIKTADLLNGKNDWKVLPYWKGQPRASNMMVVQNNGNTECIYIFGGKNTSNGETQYLNDLQIFNPMDFENGKEAWQTGPEMPVYVSSGTAVPVGQNHILILSGAVLSEFAQEIGPSLNRPSGNGKMLAFNTITQTWFEAGETPSNPLNTTAVKNNNKIFLAGGLIKPGTCTPKVWRLSPVQQTKAFGWLNSASLAAYLLLMLGIGIFFSYRNKNTDDFFRGGQRVPWWAAGLSIFATILSSITFIAIPAKAYATDWVQSIVNLGILLAAPFLITFILPFFRKIDATSAYEYLEQRFNVFVRLLASASFVFFQIGRMAIVMFLPSLALATITPLSVEMCILIMGMLSIIYCTLGGIEAVIWTDAIQSFILLAGAVLSFILIIVNLKGGLSEFYSVAAANNKFHLANWDWDITSFTRSAFWVVFLGGIAQAVVPGTSDQAVIQRYMSVDSESKARKAIWTNAIVSMPATIIFFGLGTALFVFYKANPAKLDPHFQIDAIFPLFIANELPAGLAGLVIAGIFSAAQSTISTSMNSTSTAIVTDFVKRFSLLKSERRYLFLARILTATLGLLGTGIALLMANADIISLWDTFMKVLGLFGGPLCGIFLLGMFSKKANTAGAVVGLIAGIIAVAWIQNFTDVSYLIHAGTGIIVTFLAGYLMSFVKVNM